jgi:hypothetical protein
MHVPVTSSSVLASPYLAGWPLSSQRFEAELGSLSLRLTLSASRGFARMIAHGRRPVRYMVHRHFTW